MTATRNDSARGQAGEVETAQTTTVFSYPRPNSVKAAVLADLLQGRRDTHLDCWLEHGSSRLAHHVLRLRQAGWAIETREIEVPMRDGRVARIAEYMLPERAIGAAGDAGQEYVAAVRKARGVAQ